MRSLIIPKSFLNLYRYLQYKTYQIYKVKP